MGNTAIGKVFQTMRWTFQNEHSGEWRPLRPRVTLQFTVFGVTVCGKIKMMGRHVKRTETDKLNEERKVSSSHSQRK